MMTRNTKIPASQWGVAALFFVLSLITLALFVRVAEPPERQPGVKFNENYDESRLVVNEAGVKQELAAIQRATAPAGQVKIGRMPGLPGYEATATLIEQTLAASCGRENVLTQQFPVVVPYTQVCEIYDAADPQRRPLPGVTLYPFEPAGMAPTALPPAGITGPLMTVKSKAPLDLVGKDKHLEGSIVLNDGLDTSWAMLASMGAKAVIVKEETFKQGDPDAPAAWTNMTNVYDQPFPRFLAQGPLEKYANKQLGIRCTVVWKSVDARNIIGILRAKNTASEALVVNCYYDSYSMVPDLAPGAEQALSPAVMLHLVKALAPFRDTMTRDVIFVATAGHAQALEGAVRLNEAIEDFTTSRKDYVSFETQIDEHQTKLGYAQQALGMLEDETIWRATDNNAYRQEWQKQPKAFRDWFESCFTTVAGEINLDRRNRFLDARLAWIRGGQPNFKTGFNAQGRDNTDWRNRDPLMFDYLAAKRDDNTSGNIITTPFWNVANNLRQQTPSTTAADMPDICAEHLRPWYEKHGSTVACDRFTEWGYLAKARAYFARIEAYHNARIKELTDNIALRAAFKQYDKTLTVNLELYSGGALANRDLAVLMGRRSPGTVVEPQSTDLRNAIDEKVPSKGAEKAYKVTSWGSKDAEATLSDPNIHSQWQTELESEIWFRCARQSFTVINKTFFPAKIGTPEDRFAGLATTGLADQVPPLAKALLAIAHGKVGFKRLQYIPGNDSIVTIRGTVFANAGVSAAIPNHRVGENTFIHPFMQKDAVMTLTRGIHLYPIMQADPYGDYCRRFNFDLSAWGNPITVDALRFDDNGYIAYYKDASAKSQATFKNEIQPSSELTVGSEKPINLEVFRAAQVACYQRGNPKTLNSFASFDFIQKQGMQAPLHAHPEISPAAPGISAFLDPDCVFYIAMLDGSAANPEVQTFRAFMLGNYPEDNTPESLEKFAQTYLPLMSEKSNSVSAAANPTPDVVAKQNTKINPPDADQGELNGQGYLAAGWQADDPQSAMPYLNITFPYFDAAASMIRTNGIRLAKENTYYMADNPMKTAQDLAKSKLRDAMTFRAKGDAVNATLAAGSALAYTENNHPVIRTKISNAIIGILWYLMILVPFVFFFEKLAFGFTDIRKQLLAYGVIFVVVFLALWYFHPAFQMVNQPLIILLGFLILLLALIVSAMVAGKFQQTIKVLRSKEGIVEGADVNRSGVIGTAFMLGLNNMRRRKVRTSLTCVTLVLITFVMICFTSVSTDINNEQVPTGKSPSNGLMRRDQNFIAIQEGEINNLTQLFGMDYPISVNTWLVGAINQTAFKNTDIPVDYTRKINGEDRAFSARNIHGAISMPWNEPAFTEIDKCLITHRGWFPAPPQTEAEILAATGKPMPDYIMLPDSAAKDLGLTPEMVDKGHELVTIRGVPFEVCGIFDAAQLTAKMGIDGQSILPYDLNTVTQLGRSAKGEAIVPANIGRLNGSQVIITSKPLAVKDASEQSFSVSVSVLFPSSKIDAKTGVENGYFATASDWTIGGFCDKTGYRMRTNMPMKPWVNNLEQRRVIDEYLERTGQPAYYAIDGYAYYGYRTRAKTTQNMMFMLIPIFIAALTVFNTMLSSVYERKEEIYVYNAVGIAPNHIFFMFMAEASVYAVMGAMLGYLLSQITGKVLIALGMTGGLNMDYSSIETIIVSVVIVGAVLLSTLVPAYTASRLALPSDEASWTVPKADGDEMVFNLPFTFGTMDRLAVISYFHRWLDANGEGSAGSFYCAPPEPKIIHTDGEPNSDGLVPHIETTVWLKPFDLGVSQRLDIALPTDPETGEFIARITIERLSGTVSAWNRAVMPFLTALRKQFLNWRAVSDAERTEMFEEARMLLLKPFEQERAND